MEEIRVVNFGKIVRISNFIDWQRYVSDVIGNRIEVLKSYPVLKEKQYLLTKVFCNFYNIEIVRIK